jgi:hypothetical protein
MAQMQFMKYQPPPAIMLLPVYPPPSPLPTPQCPALPAIFITAGPMVWAAAQATAELIATGIEEN